MAEQTETIAITSNTTIHRDIERCTKCRGKCCRIYSRENYDGMMWWFPEFVATFHANRKAYGVEPSFDPLEVHARGNEKMLGELKARGIDPDACEYLGADGCIISWDRRPLHCRSYQCHEWKRKQKPGLSPGFWRFGKKEAQPYAGWV